MTLLCNPDRATLVAIDLQQRLMPAIHDSEQVIAQASVLLRAAKTLAVPALATEQYPAGLGRSVAPIATLCDHTIEKTDFDACAVPDFVSALDSQRSELVVVGCEAHVCVLQTVLSALAHRRVYLVVDAIGSRAPYNRELAIQRAVAAGAQAVSAEMIVFEWLGHARHPYFKKLSKLLR